MEGGGGGVEGGGGGVGIFWRGEDTWFSWGTEGISVVVNRV